MDAFLEMLTRRAEDLLGRTAGPLNFRLLVMPLVVSFFAVRAAMRDGRQGGPSFFRMFLTQPDQRAPLIRSALKDIGKVIVVAVVLDAAYQLLVLELFYPGELLIVVMVSAVLPYLVVRSAVSPLMRRIYGKCPKAASPMTSVPRGDLAQHPVPPAGTDRR